MSLDLRERIRDVPDFPTAGVVFKDLMPLIADPEYFAETIRLLAEWAGPREPDLILGAEARGFIFGAPLAYELGAGFIAARKSGKLPRETVEATYALEYGTDSLQVHRDAVPAGARVIVVDDVLATGGTAHARNADIVFTLGADDARAMSAVAVVVHRVGCGVDRVETVQVVNRAELVVVIRCHRCRTHPHVFHEVLVRVINAGIEHGNHDFIGAGGGGPGERRADVGALLTASLS